MRKAVLALCVILLASIGGVNAALGPLTHSVVNLGLGFASGTIATTTVYPYQQVPAYAYGTITTIRAACATADNGTSIIHVLDNGSDITSSPYTLTNGGTTTTIAITAYALVPGHILHLTVTTAGTAVSCGFTAEGLQSNK